jgi:hypothetical protein
MQPWWKRSIIGHAPCLLPRTYCAKLYYPEIHGIHEIHEIYSVLMFREARLWGFKPCEISEGQCQGQDLSGRCAAARHVRVSTYHTADFCD